jgi:general secretion pathway protein D
MSAQGGNRLRSALRTEASGVAATGRIRKFSGHATLAIMGLILGSCEETKSLGPFVHEQPAASAKSGATAAGQSTAAPEVANAPARVLTEQPETVLGSGEFVAPVPAAGGAATQNPAGDITLNFVNADVREVLPRVLGDVLHLNYTIDPKVQATITVQTSRPLRQQDVLPVLQEVLRASGLTLVASDGIYRLLASEDAARSGAVPVTIGASAAANATARPYNIQILPLKYVAATELQRTLDPFVPKSAIMQVDATRNLLILSGTGIDLSTITDMVKAFDVDWIAGMSYGIIPVQTGSPKSIADQLTTIFGPKGTVPLPGMLSFAPLERMNAILVVSPQRAYVEQARLWIERLDRGESDNRAHIYEYHVQNSRAADLAKVLTGLFSSGQVSTVQPQTAPGTTPTQIGSGNYTGTTGGASMTGASSLTQGSGLGSSSLTGSQPGTGGTSPGGATSLGSGLLQTPAPPGAGATSDQSAGGPTGGGSDANANSSTGGALSLPPVRIVADEKNNNIVIFAQPRDYRMIEQALQKLDIVPLQVLIEATIAEVTLGNDLQYGLQYFFHAHENQFIFGSTTAAITNASSIAGTFPGFNYILGSTNANVVLNLLSHITNVHVVSAPELLVLDHQSASLLVGNQVPIPTAQSQSTVTSGAPLVTTVQYIDTGVILKVSPRVNANGLITLDVGQEVSSVATGATSTLGPTITQRRIESTITVQDGETVALGGLIQDTNSITKDGLPVLSDVPVLGALFRSTDRNVARTELLVLLSPKVLHNASDARAATDELQSRLHSLQRPDTQIP